MWENPQMNDFGVFFKLHFLIFPITEVYQVSNEVFTKKLQNRRSEKEKKQNARMRK